MAALGLAALAIAAPAGAQLAQQEQQPATASEPGPPPPERAAREQELERLRAEQRKAAENAAKLAREAAALGQDRGRLSRALIETAGRLREIEPRIAVAEGRIKSLDANENSIRATLDGRRATIAELLAALQRMGRRPPPALLSRPEDALESVRTAIMLGAVLPEMRAEAQTLAGELGELVRVRRELAAEREELSRDLASLSEERQRLTLLIDERQKRQTEAEKALDIEKQRATALARQADSLKDLLAKLEQESTTRARPTPVPESGAGPAPPRLGPAIAFASAKGALPLPVNGIRLRVFGTADGVGGIEKGMSIAARPGAQVTAPCDGWVVYAGPFRSYGQLLILNAGGGYHVLLAGMDRISVDLGQFVLTGEPVATMGGAAKAAAIAIGSTQPTLYIEFRKDGVPVDPGPWWANSDSEKVRG